MRTLAGLRRFPITMLLALLLAGCGTLRTMDKLEDSAGSQMDQLWERWIAAGGDIAETATWSRRVKPGVKVADVEQAFAQVAIERNMRAVGELPLSRELESRTGQKQKFLKVYSYCSPETARRMVDFSPAMAAFMPCRMTLVEHDDGSLWIYTLNMDMMVKMGRKLPSPLKEEALQVRDTIWLMLERGAKGEF